MIRRKAKGLCLVFIAFSGSCAAALCAGEEHVSANAHGPFERTRKDSCSAVHFQYGKALSHVEGS